MNKLVNKPLIASIFNNTIVASGVQAKGGKGFLWGSTDTETHIDGNDFVDHLVNLCFSNCQ